MERKPEPPEQDNILLWEQQLETLSRNQALGEAQELKLRLETVRREQAKLLRQFVRENSAALLRLATRLVGRNDAPDVAQEAFVRLAKHIRAKPLNEVMVLLGSPKDLWRLMHRITACRAYEHLRSKQRTRNRMVEFTADHETVDSSASKIEGMLPPCLDTGIELERLERAYEQLPPAQRIAHVLHYHYGFTDADLETTLGLTKSNSRTLVHRAHCALRRAMGVKQ